MREELLPRFIEIPAGEFTMGSADGDDDDKETFFANPRSQRAQQFLAKILHH